MTFSAGSSPPPPRTGGGYTRGHRMTNQQYTTKLLGDMQSYDHLDRNYFTVSAPNTFKLRRKQRRVHNPISASLQHKLKTWLALQHPTWQVGVPSTIVAEYNVPNRRYYGLGNDRLHHHKTSRKMKPDLTRWMQRSLHRHYAPPGTLSARYKGGKGYHLVASRRRSDFPPAAVAIPRRSTKRKLGGRGK